MYQVNLGAKVLYYPASEDAVIYDTELNEEVGLAGEFTFKVPPQNPLYSELTQGALVTILKDNVEVWRGEIRNIDTDFAKIASVYCLEDLAWLADEYLTPALITNETFAQRFQAAIGAYNANRSTERRFAVGYITNVNSSNNCTWRTEYEESILECLRKCICQAGTVTGYIKVRRVTSGGSVTRYIDIVRLSDYGSQTTQPIEYGYNLLNYVKESDCSNLVNVLTPYGDDLDSEIYEGYSAKLQGTTITNTSSVNIYGRHAKAVVFDGVTTLASLNALAASYLTRYSQPQLTMEVEAVDLSAVESADEITIGDSVRIIAQPFAVDQWLYLTQIKRDIQNIDKNSITLSGYVRTGRTITSQTVQATDALKNLPSESSILQAAKRNALAMLLDETKGGYVVFEFDSNNEYMVAINICDAPTIAASKKRWRWSSTGFGYMKRSAGGTETTPAWSEAPIAITMDGQIVADAVTTGTMYADRIKGGTLTLGGSANADGVLKIKDASGNVIGTWDNTGINATKGSFSGSLNAATGSFKGSLDAATGSFKGSLDAATGSFSGSLNAARGTLTDGVGTLSLSGGDLHMRNGNSGGPGVFASKTNSPYYSCWGAVNSAAQDSDSAGGYIETSTKNIVQAGIDVSDMRLKEDIKDIDKDFAQALIMGIQPKTFHYKDGNNLPAELQFGVIAQEIQSIEEEYGITEENRLCYEQNDGMLAVQYKQLIAPMIKVIQNLQEQINELKGEKNG